MTTSAIVLPSAPPTRSGTPRTVPPGFVIRARRPDDIAALCDVLTRQQPVSLYPIEWPLPIPIPQFLERDGEVAALVAEKTDTKQVVGHVSICRVVESSHVDGGQLGPKWAAAYGCSIEQLRVIGVLFTDHTLSGKGVGSALFNAAVEMASKGDLKPVLDCLSTNVTALNFYLRRGWKIIGEWRDAPWLPADRKDLVVHLLILPEADADGAVDGAADTTKRDTLEAVQNGRV